MAYPHVFRMSNTYIQRKRTQMFGNTVVILLYGGRSVYAVCVDLCASMCIFSILYIQSVQSAGWLDVQGASENFLLT
jgi:hypothetical protein